MLLICQTITKKQNTIDILNGVKLGDNVEINIYGILKSGKISVLNKQFVQLKLKVGYIQICQQIFKTGKNCQKKK